MSHQSHLTLFPSPRSVSVKQLGESFHFYVYICVKGGSCEDLSHMLYRPAAEAPPACMVEDTDPDILMRAICLDSDE